MTIIYIKYLNINNALIYMDGDLSISIILNNGIKNSIEDSIESDFFKKKKQNYWVNDETVSNCTNCNRSFTLTNRKHHCRCCGKIFCNACSNYYVMTPKTIEIPIQNKYFTYNYFMENGKNRVCVDCYNNIDDIKNLNEITKFFNLLPLDIKDYTNINFVCHTWNRIANNYFNKFKGLYYKFPNYKFNLHQKKILYINRYYFSGHSKYLVQLLISTDWQKITPKKRNNILNLLDNSDRICSCKLLRCSHTCKYILDIEDIFIVLSRKIICKPLIKKLFVRLKNIIFKQDRFVEFNCYLYLLINSLHFYKNYTSLVKIIETFILQLCVNNIEISNQLFWLLTQFIDNPESGLYFKRFRIELVDQLNKETYKLFQNGYDFTQNIIKIAESDPINAVINLKKYLKEYSNKTNKFTLPINVCKEFNAIDYDKLRDVDSKTKPIILPCIYEQDKIYNIMLKNEDIRKEAIIMNVIKLIDFFLKREEGIDLKIITYNILPISSKYGYIEFVPNSSTLYHIKEDLNFSIQNWIIENNQSPDINAVRDNICKSCAAYCVITYLLGIGDRHLDNIMITNNGILFHIDFGYILGKDPKIMSPEIRLTPEIIDAMGGIHSKYYKNFKKYVNVSFKCMRRHSRIFYLLLCNLTNIYPKPLSISEEYIYNYIFTRFMPDGKTKYAIQQMEEKIDYHSAKNSYAETIIDYFHKKYKISSSTKSSEKNTVDKAVEYSIKTKNSVVNSIYNWFK